MFRDFFVFVLACSFLAASCKQIELPPNKPAGEVPFYASLQLDGMTDSIYLAASVDRAYVLDVTHEKETADLLSAKMWEQWCPEACGPFFEIQLLDYSEFFGGDFDLTEAVSPAVLLYSQGGADTVGLPLGVTYLYTLRAESTGGLDLPPESYHWSAGNGSFDSTGKEIYIEWDNSFSFELCLSVVDASFESTSCVVLDSTGILCGAKVVLSGDTLNGYVLEAQSIGQEAVNYTWNFGGVSGNALDVTDPGFYCVALQSMSSNCNAVSCVTYTGDLQNLLWDVYVKVLDVQEIPMSSLRRVVLIYTDETGKEYRSDAGTQSSGSSFAILDSELYQHPSDSRTFYAVNWEATNAVLYAADGSAVVLTSAKGKFAFAE